MRRRAEEAMGGYVGELTRLRGSIDLACRIVADIEKTLAKSRATSK